MAITAGFRIYQHIERPRRELVDLFKGIPSSNINDNMNRLFSMHSYMRPFNKVPLLGTAVTVKAPMGDNLMIHKALDIAEPGDIIVVDGEGCTERSSIGEMMFTFAEMKGIAGIVIDGAIRDTDSLSHLNLSIYAKAVTPQGPFKNGPGEINVPVSCGGQVVFPGDILVGDADGIVVIRPEFAEELAEVSRKKHDSEEERLRKQHAGHSEEAAHCERFDGYLKKIGNCAIIN